MNPLRLSASNRDVSHSYPAKGNHDRKFWGCLGQALCMSDNPKVTDKYPSLVISGYIDTVKGKPLTLYPSGGYIWFLGCPIWVSLLCVFSTLVSDASTLVSERCWEPNSPPVGAILVVICGDLSVDVVCEQKHSSKQIMNAIGDFECFWVYLKILKVAVTFGGMKASYIDFLCHGLVFHCTFDPMKPGWEKETIVTHIPPFFVICSNSDSRILDRSSPLFNSGQ